MKFATCFVVASAVSGQDDRKVPPRHPLQRLNRLQIFSEEWLNDNIAHLPSVQKWIGKFKLNAARMESAFNRKNPNGERRCGFYDENLLPHGGPDPHPDLRNNESKKPRRPVEQRRRRDAEEEAYISDDGSLERYDKSNPIRGIKQITTGYRKWAERFINECYGQRKNNSQVKRMGKWFEKLGQHYVSKNQ